MLMLITARLAANRHIQATLDTRVMEISVSINGFISPQTVGDVREILTGHAYLDVYHTIGSVIAWTVPLQDYTSSSNAPGATAFYRGHVPLFENGPVRLVIDVSWAKRIVHPRPQDVTTTMHLVDNMNTYVSDKTQLQLMAPPEIVITRDRHQDHQNITELVEPRT